MDLLKNEKGQLADFNNPFNKKSVDRIYIATTKDWKGNISWYGAVEFKNGNTKGSQEVRDESFHAIVKKIDDFVNSLE